MKYIYLIKTSNDLYKIGIADNVKSRLTNIQTSNPNPIKLVTCNRIEDAQGLEKLLHQKHVAMRTQTDSEWFQLPPEKALEICMEIHSFFPPPEKPFEKQIREAIGVLITNEKSIGKRLKHIEDDILVLRDKHIKEKKVMDVEKIKKPKKNMVNDEEMVQKAIALIKEHDYLSASFMQRKLRIGYSRAARIMDELVTSGVNLPDNKNIKKHDIL